ncbi:MAG: TatD family hydrolase [Erysipelotrichales bacterium]|nr:TatD family hydrolase [Erysipelotrichales bacterium]
MAYWIDSHSHMIFDEFKKNFEEYIQRAVEQNVRRIMCVCLNKEQLQRGFELKEKYPFFDLSIGYFPLDIPKITEQDWKDLEELVQDERVVAVGEIGLDYFWDTSYNDLQKECFIRQIELANKVNKPIIVHTRDAHEDALEVLLAHPPVKGGIMHCYSGSLENARKLEPLGMCFAFGGPLTYTNSLEGKDVVREMPLSCLLVETDCPSLPPQAHQGEMSETSYVHYPGECVASLKGISVEEVQEQMQINYEKLFGKMVG